MTYTFIKAARHGGTQGKINRIVIHCTVTPCEPGWAVKVARYFQTVTRPASAHFVVDPKKIVRCLPDHIIAYHAPPNTGSIGVELCDWQKGKSSRWQDESHQDMMELAADLVSDLAKQYNIPLVWLTPTELKAGKRGICGHIDVSKAWGLTDHGDPMAAGPFPKDQFMRMVKGKPSNDNWTETMINNLPTLKVGDDNFDVKTARHNVRARGRAEIPPEIPVSDWLDRTLFDTQFKANVIEVQKAVGLNSDGIIGPKTWQYLITRETPQ